MRHVGLNPHTSMGFAGQAGGPGGPGFLGGPGGGAGPSSGAPPSGLLPSPLLQSFPNLMQPQLPPQLSHRVMLPTGISPPGSSGGLMPMRDLHSSGQFPFSGFNHIPAGVPPQLSLSGQQAALIAQDATKLPGGASAGGPGALVVPVEYANQKLWSVTSEYENLLNIQKDHHNLATRQREAEIAHLQAVVEMLETDQLDETSVVGRLRAKDGQAALTMQAKHKELELFAHLLQLRDRQIGDLQQMCEEKQAQINDCQQRMAAESDRTNDDPVKDQLRRLINERDRQLQAAQADLRVVSEELSRSRGTREAVTAATTEAEELRKEKEDLEQLLLTKERQLGALSNLDPDMTDTSALQLGAQAIQMFHDSIRLKTQAADNQDEKTELRGELEKIRIRNGDLETTLASKRKEIKELMSALSTKTHMVVEIETELESFEKESQQAKRDSLRELDALRERLAATEDEGLMKQRFVEQLKSELAVRDQRVLEKHSEGAKYETSSRRLENKVAEMSAQLQSAELALGQMMRSSAAKDQLMHEMTEQVNISETKLHSYQVQGLLDSRQRQLPSMQFQNNSGQQGQMQQQQQQQQHQQQQQQQQQQLALHQNPGSFLENILDQGNTYCSGQPSATGERPPYSARSSAATRSAAATPFQATSPSLSSSALIQDSGLRGPLLGCASGSPRGPAADAPVSLGQCYRPQAGDLVDAKLADFVNQPGHRFCKALFCRLSEGMYLYGTHRSSLRVSPVTQRLQALDEASGWVAIDEFVRGMEQSQGVHLQRAKEVAGTGATDMPIARSSLPCPAGMA